MQEHRLAVCAASGVILCYGEQRVVNPLGHRQNADVPMSMGTARHNALSTRDVERINWIEFRQWVPSKIDTVLLPLGTLEPHGVAPNGTNILAPVAMAREIAARVNAMVAPVIPYGFTGVMDAYPGSFTVPEDALRSYARAVLTGLA